MTPLEARDIMLAPFLAEWLNSGQAADRVVWDDKPATVPTGEAAWARVTIRHYGGPTRAFGERTALYSNTGLLTVQVFTPVGGANTASYNIGYAVVRAYRKAANEGVSFREPRLKEVGVSGAFEQLNVLTDFSYDD